MRIRMAALSQQGPAEWLWYSQNTGGIVVPHADAPSAAPSIVTSHGGTFLAESHRTTSVQSPTARKPTTPCGKYSPAEKSSKASKAASFIVCPPVFCARLAAVSRLAQSIHTKALCLRRLFASHVSIQLQPMAETCVVGRFEQNRHSLHCQESRSSKGQPALRWQFKEGNRLVFNGKSYLDLSITKKTSKT